MKNHIRQCSCGASGKKCTKCSFENLGLELERFKVALVSALKRDALSLKKLFRR